MNIQDSLIGLVVLPDNEASFLTNCDEVDIAFCRLGAHNDLVNTLIPKYDSATFADEARVYVKHYEAVLYGDTISDEETSTGTKSH